MIAHFGISLRLMKSPARLVTALKTLGYPHTEGLSFAPATHRCREKHGSVRRDRASHRRNDDKDRESSNGSIVCNSLSRT
jgi:hypothetical protein